jgi:putative spermidine/putrescine transport system substrate-binding protein
MYYQGGLMRKLVQLQLHKILLPLWLVLAMSCKAPPQPASGTNELVVTSYGGAFQEAQRKAFFEPFEKETGIKIKEAQWSGEYGKLKAMVTAGQPIWDLVTAAEASVIARGAKEGILEPIDYTGIDKSKFYPESLTDHSVGFDFFSTAIAYNTRDAVRPRSWGEFWDTKHFPGRRSLRNDPRTTLEFALLADGVAKEALYPLDVDRAFRSLDRIRPDVGVWWTTGSQPPQLLADGEVKFASAFNGRIWTAAVRDKLPLAVEWNGGALDTDSWIIPKGAKNREAALALIRYTTRPEAQIALTRYISYGPTLREAYDRLSPEQRSILPSSPENRVHQFVFNGNWWAENESAVLERWTKWQVGK